MIDGADIRNALNACSPEDDYVGNYLETMGFDAESVGTAASEFAIDQWARFGDRLTEPDVAMAYAFLRGIVAGRYLQDGLAATLAQIRGLPEPRVFEEDGA